MLKVLQTLLRLCHCNRAVKSQHSRCLFKTVMCVCDVQYKMLVVSSVAYTVMLFFFVFNAPGFK